MSDAPEFIYVDYTPHTETYQAVSSEPDGHATEYIRADRVRVTGFEDLPQWLPIETAPRDGTSIMTYPHWTVTHWSKEVWSSTGTGWAGGWSDDVDCFMPCSPTHWKPLGDPPT